MYFYRAEKEKGKKKKKNREKERRKRIEKKENADHVLSTLEL
mgnify:CR=1 FL=1